MRSRCQPGLILARIRTRAAAGYQRWMKRYEAFARMRGFRSFNDWPFHRRGFLECWAQPGFHRFWQVWNPGIAFFVYRLFLRLGGRRHWALPTVASFTLCGLAHTLVAAPILGRWSYSVIGAFACFGVLTVASKYLAPVLKQHRWPVMLNLIINVGLVAGSFRAGFYLDGLLRARGAPGDGTSSIVSCRAPERMPEADIARGFR